MYRFIFAHINIQILVGLKQARNQFRSCRYELRLAQVANRHEHALSLRRLISIDRAVYVSVRHYMIIFPRFEMCAVN